MLSDIVEVKVLEDYVLFLRFNDGKQGQIDISNVITFEGIFAPLKDKKYFSSVFINPELGTICWHNGADIAPDYLYNHIK